MDPNENSQAPDAPDSRKMNDIRLRRLAKLGSSNRSPKPEEGSPNPENDVETSTAATTSEGKGKSPEEATPSSTPKPTPANPFSQLGVRSTPGTSPTTESGAQKRGSSKMDDRAPAPAPVKKANVEESVDDFSDRILSHAFRVTVDPERLTDSHGHKLNFLSEASQELKDNGSPLKLTTAVLDSALLEAVTAVPADKPILGYLLPCFKRIVRTNVVKETPEKREVLEEAKRLCVSNCLFALTIPDLFGRSQPESLVSYLLRGHEQDDGVCLDFLREAVKRFPEDEQFPAAFADAMHSISTKLSGLTMENDYKPYINALMSYTKFPALLNAVSQHPNFLTAQKSGAAFEKETILGPFFRISPLQSEVTLTYFPNPRGLDRSRAAPSQDAMRAILRVHQDELFTIANAFIRADTDTRTRVLDWFAAAINANHKRRALQVDPKEVSSDGFMMNLTVILDRFCSPFMDTTFSKVDRIEVEYFRRNPRVDIKEETKLNADQSTSDAFYAKKVEGNSNFITEVFFLTLAAHHYGSEATNSKLKSLERDIKWYEKHLAAMEAERPKVQNQPAQLAMFELTLKRHTAVLEKAIAMKYAIEGVFLDEKMQELSLRFMRYVAVWLLRLASQTNYTPDKDLQLPLPAEEPEAFACLPEYALQDVVDNFKFVYRYLPQIMPSAVGSEMIALCIAFLRSSEYIKNPYLKSSLVTLLFSGTWPFMHFKKGVLGDQLYGSKFANENLLHALMKFYIEAESTGAHTQFYDKFNIRYEIFQVIKCVWGNDVYKQQLTRESKVNRQFFVQFVNLLLNDATYVLDEALTKFPKIHTLQQELEFGNSLSAQDREKKQEELQALEGQAGSYMQLANETLAMMKLFTSALASAFTMPEIVQRLASMLNYNLETLAGPKMGQLKVNNPTKYHFQPRVLLSDFVDIYLNLGSSQAFIDAVASDGRSYKPEVFDKAGFILSKRSMKDAKELEQFNSLKAKFLESKQISDQAELDLGDIPAEFEDPIMGDLMKDPVILPSKHIVDRGTIVQHLLSDPKDPFTRQPMTVDDAIPHTELKEKIQKWREEKIAAAKARTQGEAMDTTEG
ncbi:ubiquitin elongating factor core [Colletotrichum sublineola]|uniref:Putative ubiquitin elongating factor core n=1 Tax=Colletotrichum sublineola TaxID=1173701 RepID=A0A066XQ73_COLSU|nr:ubiquitin elongating factor core [Colletotrichum sublineola]KDN71032.1 putative ubiquitin elongating factor core [Colletotrichum sublineola]